jgi:hypothetical protein
MATKSAVKQGLSKGAKPKPTTAFRLSTCKTQTGERKTAMNVKEILDKRAAPSVLAMPNSGSHTNNPLRHTTTVYGKGHQAEWDPINPATGKPYTALGYGVGRP